ncbi:hypothetical protein BB560_007009 [Smittium megazygosporum]|uniref:Inner membrane component domain-containing protein n=1 Tax=Smittium megazygosporum TaxID=133381 RepID=A0A2T9XZJ7_9FUNG|nr:hypothetical protein BB560_007009 [Smittium megazygosporum]
METISVIGNVFWIILGGWVNALAYFLGGLVMMITIVGIPFGFALWKLAVLALLPFGKDVKVERVTGWHIFGNIVWLLLFGWAIALSHVFFGILFFITIIGIPFGYENFKLAKLAIWPLGVSVKDRVSGLPM